MIDEFLIFTAKTIIMMMMLIINSSSRGCGSSSSSSSSRQQQQRDCHLNDDDRLDTLLILCREGIHACAYINTRKSNKRQLRVISHSCRTSRGPFGEPQFSTCSFHLGTKRADRYHTTSAIIDMSSTFARRHRPSTNCVWMSREAGKKEKPSFASSRTRKNIQNRGADHQFNWRTRRHEEVAEYT